MASKRTKANAGAAGPSSGVDARGPDGEDGFVVIDDDFVEPGRDDELSHPSGSIAGRDPAAQDAAPFSPGAFPALGASLSASATSSSLAGRSSPPSEPADETAPRFDAAAAAVVAAGDLVYRFLFAYAVVGYKFLHAHGGVAFDFLYAHALVAFEFLYAYAVVAVQEALALLERVWSRARPAWRRWQERGPAPVKRVVKHRLFPVAVAVALSMLLVFPAFWAIPRGGGGGGGGGGADGQRRMSTRQWQAQYDLMNSKYSADLVRQRLKYDSLAGRHLELQSEYESLLKDYKNQQRAARTNRNGPKAPPETCDKAESVLGPVKEAFKVAEQSAYEYFSHFSQGLREDVHEIAERCLDKTGEGGRGGGSAWGGGGSGDGGGKQNGAREHMRCPNGDERRNLDDRVRDETDTPMAAIEHDKARAGAGGHARQGGGEPQPAPEHEKIEGGFQSQQQQQQQQQGPGTQQVRQLQEIEAERLRARPVVGRRGNKSGKRVGWALKVEKPEKPDVAELEETGSEADVPDDPVRGARTVDDVVRHARDYAARTRSARQAVRRPSSDRAEGDTFEAGGSAGLEDEEVGTYGFSKAGKQGQSDGTASSADADKEASDDPVISDALGGVDEAAPGDANVVRDVDATNDVDDANDKKIRDREQVVEEGASVSGSQGSGSVDDVGKEEDAARKRSGQIQRMKAALLSIPDGIEDGDVKAVPKDPDAKDDKPEEVTCKDAEVIGKQLRKTSQTTPEGPKGRGVKPQDSNTGGDTRLVQLEEADRKSSTAGSKRKGREPKGVMPRDGKNEHKAGNWKDYWLKDEGTKSTKKKTKKKKKSKGGKSKAKKKD